MSFTSSKSAIIIIIMIMCSLCSSSWDEHVFELVLPKACMVGHVDFKFVLNANIVNIPQIQVTLLKNKAPGLGKVSGEDSTLRFILYESFDCCSLYSIVHIHPGDEMDYFLVLCLVLLNVLSVFPISTKTNWKVLNMKPLSGSESCFSCLQQRQQWTDRSPSPSPMSSMSTGRETASLCCMTSQRTSSSWT